MSATRIAAGLLAASLAFFLGGCAAWNMAKAEEQADEAEDVEKSQRFAEAASLYQTAVHYTRTAYPDGCDREILYRSRRASCLFRAGQYKDALAESKTAVALARRLNGPDHPSVAAALIPQAAALQQLGYHKEAGAATAESQRILKSQR